MRVLLLLITSAAIAVAAGCSPQPTLKVGAKAFAEQKVLAEFMRGYLQAKGYRVAPVVLCGDTYGCQGALRDGRVDLMVEYTGTGLRFAGGAGRSDGSALETLRARYDPLNLRWVGLLGFDNGYRVVMRADSAAAHAVGSIADLDHLERGVRLACPREFLRRPGDGLGALARRYGLRLDGDPVLIDGSAARTQALVDGRVDVAILYATDGATRGLELVNLDDNLHFFPPYDAAILARQGALDDNEGLHDDLAKLLGTMDVAAIRDLNYKVEVEGRDPSAVAAAALQQRALVDDPLDAPIKAPMKIAYGGADHVEVLAERAARATHRAFPERPVRAIAQRHPIDAVVRGTARLAMVGAEAFFLRGPSGWHREDRVEAVAVVGTRVVHVLRRRDDPSTAPLAGAVGIMPSRSGGGLVGRELLRRAGATSKARAEVARLIEEVASGDLDAALVVAEAGDPLVARALSSGSLKLRSLSLPALTVGDEPTYLRLARLPPGTYAGQDAAVDTVSSQVVLVSSSAERTAGQVGGPASALLSVSLPLTSSDVRALADAVGTPEAPDPILPSAWAPRTGRDLPQTGPDRVVDATLNLGVLAFVAWLVLLVVRHR